MLDKFCAEIRNYFVKSSGDIHEGTFVITNGKIESLPFIQSRQYYRIVGSIFNDGVYCRGEDDLTLCDEEFVGQIWAMRVPRAFIDLCNEIEAWNEENADTLNNPFISESYSGYSYTKGSSNDSSGYSWRNHFANRLNQYRRINL